jgi:hypothetical protein
VSQANLDPDDFWEADFSEDHPEGALYPEVPLLSWQSTPVTLENELAETQLYLPTRFGAGLLYRKFHDHWWFFPLVTADGFADTDYYNRLLQRVRDGATMGFWEVPSLDESPLSEGALVYVWRPTVIKQALVEELSVTPTAKLRDEALLELDEAVSRALQR